MGQPKRFLLAALAAFAVIFALDFLVHSVLLMNAYEQTAAVWRPREQAGGMMWMMTLSQALFALAMTWFYTKGYERGKPGLGQGLRFGCYAGVLLAAGSGLVWYVVLPIPLVLNLAWLGSYFLDALASGVVIGLLYHS